MTVLTRVKHCANTDNEWACYFCHNRAQLLPIDWHNTYQLTAFERDTITQSIQQFQLGESSDGAFFLRLAETYVARTGDTSFIDALSLFIAEEQRHSRNLARFMKSQNIPILQSDPVDSVFRLLRHLLNLEVAVVVLLSAEVVAMAYYKALHDATNAKTLRDICRQILRDEVEHLKFQTETLRKLRTSRSAFGSWLTNALQHIFFAGTLCVVWASHYRVYRAAGFGFSRFWQANWSRFRHTFKHAINKVEA